MSIQTDDMFDLLQHKQTDKTLADIFFVYAQNVLLAQISYGIQGLNEMIFLGFIIPFPIREKNASCIKCCMYILKISGLAIFLKLRGLENTILKGTFLTIPELEIMMLCILRTCV